jgi:mannose-1-phosphate guanylyltransferase
MKAILLSAGYGSRLAPITNLMPKCLVTIKGVPLLEYWLELLLPTHIDKVLINTHYLPSMIEDFVKGHKFSHKITTSYEEILLGTAGTILKNKLFFDASDFLVAHADNLTKFDISSFIETHKKRPSHVDITMMTFDSDTPESCGIVVEDSSGIVTKFFEKVKNPPSNKANAAVYIMSYRVVKFIESINKEVVDISLDVIPNFLGKIQTFHNDQYHRDIGTPESLALANNEFIL